MQEDGCLHIDPRGTLTYHFKAVLSSRKHPSFDLCFYSQKNEIAAFILHARSKGIFIVYALVGLAPATDIIVHRFIKSSIIFNANF